MSPEAETLIHSLRSRVASDPELAALNLPSLARPSVRLATQRVPDARLEIGNSRIGGVPDVPPGFEWPRWMPTDARNQQHHPNRLAPLGFIAQFDLRAIPQIDKALPDTGWLYFFYDLYCQPWGFDPADRGCCRVIYADCDRTALVRTQPPDDAAKEHVFEPCFVESWTEVTLPENLSRVKYGSPGFDAYHALCDELSQRGGLTQHRLLGHAQPIQNEMELECQLVSSGLYCGDSSGYQSEQARVLKSGAADWRLLLQIDTDEEGPGWMWGDVGRIYFWIRKQDLAARRFDDVWLIFQCC